jgi:hypothetical protein
LHSGNDEIEARTFILLVIVIIIVALAGTEEARPKDSPQPLMSRLHE